MEQVRAFVTEESCRQAECPAPETWFAHVSDRTLVWPQ